MTVSCIASPYSDISLCYRRKRKIEEEQQNLRNKQKENANSVDRSIGDTDFEGTNAVWVSSGNIYGGGSYVPIPPKSEHTYLSLDTVDSAKNSAKINTKNSTKNSTNKELDNDSIPDTRRLILRYSGTSVESSGSSEGGSSSTSSPTITPPSTAPSSSIMPPSKMTSTAGYEAPRASFVGSDVSLSSLYGKDAGMYDSILTDLEPRYIAHAVTDAPDQSLGHCI